MKYLDSVDLKAMEITSYSIFLKENYGIKIPSDVFDDESIFPYIDADVFRQGSCQMFAYVLNQAFGYKAYKIQSGPSFHIFCKSADYKKYIDVRGITTDFHTFMFGLMMPELVIDSSEEYSFEPDDLTGENADVGIAFARAIVQADPDRYIN